MGQFIKYKCDVCGYEHVHDVEIFWIDENFEINVSMLVFLTSTEVKVLETPITFHPGDVYAITYRIALDI